MRKPLETARRWLAQAEHSLGVCHLLYENMVWSEACFSAEQTAQVAFKASLYLKGRRFVNIHSVRQLAIECAIEDVEFQGFADYGSILDKYYLSTRYPDTLPEPAIPFESFTESEARQAHAFAKEIVELVRAKVTLEPAS
ncbi:MAG: hypothetical protein BZY88_01210 [SAR202 cluster bacterium Io17-Chloro-G9]|nr:MAG: hypothetical protein BZY88_01210 [SAR202 cluster bacterium Io17-Chloro-G9]